VKTIPETAAAVRPMNCRLDSAIIFLSALGFMTLYFKFFSIGESVKNCFRNNIANPVRIAQLFYKTGDRPLSLAFFSMLKREEARGSTLAVR